MNLKIRERIVLLRLFEADRNLFGEKSKDPIAMYLADLFTVQANLAGNPAISLPLFETEAGLPMGIQLMGKSFKEQELFNLSQLLIETCN